MKTPILLSASLFTVITILTPSIVRAEDEGFLEDPSVGDMDEGEKWIEDAFDDPSVSAEPAKEVDIEYFFDKLSPHGQWLQTEKYGLVWQPSGLANDWQPYTFGHWVYTDYGWTWVSSFPWGWAAFHYGSWAHLESRGWIWVPSGTWSPARVVWRYSDSHVGWAPIIAGYDYWYGWAHYPVFYSHWTFISWSHFCHHHPHRHFLPRRWVRRIFHRSRYPRRCHDRAGPACHHGPSRRRVAKKIGYSVPRAKVKQTTSPARRRGHKRHGKDRRAARPTASPVAARFRSHPKPARARPPRTKPPETRPTKTISLGVRHVPPKTPPTKTSRAVSRTGRPHRPVTRRPDRRPRPNNVVKPHRSAVRSKKVSRTRPPTTIRHRRPTRSVPRKPQVRMRKPNTPRRPTISSRPKTRTFRNNRPRHSRPAKIRTSKNNSSSKKRKSSGSKKKTRVSKRKR